MCKIGVISQELLTEVKLLFSVNRKSYNYVVSIGTTTDNFE